MCTSHAHGVGLMNGSVDGLDRWMIDGMEIYVFLNGWIAYSMHGLALIYLVFRGMSHWHCDLESGLLVRGDRHRVIVTDRLVACMFHHTLVGRHYCYVTTIIIANKDRYIHPPISLSIHLYTTLPPMPRSRSLFSSTNLRCAILSSLARLASARESKNSSDTNRNDTKITKEI